MAKKHLVQSGRIGGKRSENSFEKYNGKPGRIARERTHLAEDLSIYSCLFCAVAKVDPTRRALFIGAAGFQGLND
jgi:hypothetical protein